MTGKCIHHPGRSAVVQFGTDKYCEKCKSGQEAAAKLVDRHVDPKACFVWYRGGDKWERITGTGCAHWVAHEKGIKKGARIHRCLEGYTYRVPDLIVGRKAVADIATVKVGDIYVNPRKDHCGLVSSVTAVKGKPPRIEIRHCSSRQGKVAKNDFATYFHSKGSFYR